MQVNESMHMRNKSDYLSKVQALPRKSIKKGQYNFADLLGDINYIGDEKLPTFQSRGLKAKQAKSPLESTKSATSRTGARKLLMSKFV